MNDTTTPRHPKRKRQPSAECMRQQLALAADEIIRLRGLLQEKPVSIFNFSGTVDKNTTEQIARIMAISARPWWRRMLGRWFV